jgi:hypothetical protein
MLRLRQKIERLTAIERRLTFLPLREAFRASRTDLALQLRDEGERIRSQDFVESRSDFAAHFDAGRQATG